MTMTKLGTLLKELPEWMFQSMPHVLSKDPAEVRWACAEHASRSRSSTPMATSGGNVHVCEKRVTGPVRSRAWKSTACKSHNAGLPKRIPGLVKMRLSLDLSRSHSTILSDHFSRKRRMTPPGLLHKLSKIA